MGLIEQAKADIKAITTNLDEFGVEMTFTPPSGFSVTIAGLHKKIRTPFDTEGVLVNTTHASVSFSEELLTDQGYTVRVNGLVSLVNHKVQVKDSTGTLRTYKVKQAYPDETVGFIVAILDDFA